MNFALIGAAGYIAPRHMQAIHDTGNQLLAAVDPHDNVGQLDRFFTDAKFFTEIERFDRYLEKLRRGSPDNRVEYISICSPNYLHDAHVRLALRLQANAICEKPLVLSPWNLSALEELESETGQKVFTVLQLRSLSSLIKLKEEVQSGNQGAKAKVSLNYITRRGRWYDVSWKGDPAKSGGIAMNIGIHFFDLLLWLFGREESSAVHLHENRRMAGTLELERASVEWFLSADQSDLPKHCVEQNQFAFRSLRVDDQEVEFSSGFTDLHTKVYEEILAGRGTGITDAKPAIELVHMISHADVVPGLSTIPLDSTIKKPAVHRSSALTKAA